MKIKNLFIYGLCTLTGFFTACSESDEELTTENTGPALLTFSIHTSQPKKEVVDINSSTRAISDIYLGTTFQSGDSVGVFAYNRNENGSDGEIRLMNGCYIYNGNNWTAAQGSEMYIDSHEALNYYVYYPYSKTVTNPHSIPYTVWTDQNTPNDSQQVMQDFMGTKEGNAAVGKSNVDLTLDHTMSLVELRFTGSLATDKNTTVTLCGVQRESIVDLETNTTASVTGTPSNITMHQINNTPGNMYFRASIPPQNIAAGSKLIEIVSGGKTYELSVDKDVTLKGGIGNSIRLNIGLNPNAQYTIEGNIDVSGWVLDEELRGKVNEETESFPFIILVPPTSSSVITDLGVSTTLWSSATDDTPSTADAGWFVRTAANQTDIVKATASDGLIAVDQTGTNGKTNAVGYNFGKCMRTTQSTRYRLNVKIKITDFIPSNTEASASIAAALVDLNDNYTTSFAYCPGEDHIDQPTWAIESHPNYFVTSKREYATESTPEVTFVKWFDLENGYDAFTSLTNQAVKKPQFNILFKHLMLNIYVIGANKYELSEISFEPQPE